MSELKPPSLPSLVSAAAPVCFFFCLLDIDVFQHHFGDLQESEQVHQLQERIRPYVLRRMKEAVEKSIPPKEETIVECELTVSESGHTGAAKRWELSHRMHALKTSVCVCVSCSTSC